MRAYLEAYGCALNVGESREAIAILARRGWELVDLPDEVDLAVLFTCVVQKTERGMLKRVRALKTARRLVITGCMATACRERSEAIAPEAEFVPPGSLEALSEALGPADADQHAPQRFSEFPFTIVPIATGCLGECAYCITQIARGRLRSRPEESIVQAVKGAISGRPTEVQLTGQDTAAYGSDIGANLPELVERVCAIPGDFRVRVGMMNPKSALPIVESLARMYSDPKVFKFLHLPVQSGSDPILRRMGRGHSVKDFNSIVSRLRSAIPDLSVSTDLIVGYPGETEEDHRANLEIISQIEPDIVNVTRFSERPGTSSARDPGKIIGGKMKERSRELTELRFAVALRKNKEWIGRTVRALATEPGKPGITIVRTEEYRRIVVPGKLKLGGWYSVRVTGATATYLKGSTEGPA